MADTPFASQKPDAAYIAALMDDTQAAYTQALVLIETSLQADFEKQPAQAVAFRSQIESNLAEGERRLRMLREAIAPWDAAKKAELGPDLAEKVDKFFALLEKGLQAVRTQLGNQTQTIEKRRDEVRQVLGEMGKQRQGFAGYKVKGNKSKLIRHEV